MITTIFTNMMGKLSVKPDIISVGPGFHKDMESFNESSSALEAYGILYHRQDAHIS
jgi:hypothetical protein